MLITIFYLVFKGVLAITPISTLCVELPQLLIAFLREVALVNKNEIPP